MDPERVLRIEGVAVLAAALATYVALDGSLVLLVVLALAPDLSMVGYLRGPVVGSTVYNVVHAYALPLALGGAGLWFDHALAAQIAAIWIGHISADRAFGYGLKYPTGFADTHLGRIGRSPPVRFEE